RSLDAVALSGSKAGTRATPDQRGEASGPTVAAHFLHGGFSTSSCPGLLLRSCSSSRHPPPTPAHHPSPRVPRTTALGSPADAPQSDASSTRAFSPPPIDRGSSAPRFE